MNQHVLHASYKFIATDGLKSNLGNCCAYVVENDKRLYELRTKSFFIAEMCALYKAIIRISKSKGNYVIFCHSNQSSKL